MTLMSRRLQATITFEPTPRPPNRVGLNTPPAVSSLNPLPSCARVIASRKKNLVVTLVRTIPNGFTVLYRKVYFVTVDTVLRSRTALRR